MYLRSYSELLQSFGETKSLSRMRGVLDGFQTHWEGSTKEISSSFSLRQNTKLPTEGAGGAS